MPQKSTYVHKQGSNIQYYGPGWLGLDGGNKVTIAAVSNSGYAYGTFGQDSITPTNGWALADGNQLDSQPLVAGTHYQYDKRLDASTTEDPTDGFGTVAGGIFDTGIAGDFSSGTYFRVVENSKSVKDGTGLNLKVYAKNLTTVVSPPSDRIYVDPALGKVLLPRPVYWSKMENLAGVLTGEIGTATQTGQADFYTGKWGNAIFDNNDAAISFVDVVIPSGLTELTSSCWVLHRYIEGVFFSGVFAFYFNSNSYVANTTVWDGTRHLELYVNGSRVYDGTYDFAADWRHVFIAVTSSYVKVWINGSLIINYSGTIPSITMAKFGYQGYLVGGYGQMLGQIDNIKVWNAALTDPSFEYNSGTGREDALHSIYGSANGYKPSNIQVGYYYVAAGNATEKQLEGASSLSNAKGSFGTDASIYKKNNIAMISGADFQYDKRLDASTTEDPVDGFGSTAGGVYDTSASGTIAAGKAIRVVENSKNIKDGTGLNLKVYAKDLSTIITPPSDRVYVDPSRNKFIMPQPVYWCKCETTNPQSDYEIAEYTPVFTSSNETTRSTPSGKFGKCLYTPPGGSGVACWWNNKIYSSVPSKGTKSVWNYMGTPDSSNLYGAICLGGEILSYNSSHPGGYFYPDIYPWGLFIYNLGTSNYIVFMNGNSVIDSSMSFAQSGISWRHLYLVWDYDKGLTGGKSIRLFADTVEVFSSTASLPASGSYGASFGCPTAYVLWYTHGYMDNFKFWNYIVSEDPSWEHNSGSGREDALHTIYGSTNGYKPNTIQVGYFKRALSKTPATCPKPGSNTAIQLEDAADYGKAVFGLGSPIAMKKSDYTALIPLTDYVYGKRLDASTTEDPTDGFGTTAGGICDTSASGTFASGKYFRIVHNAKNIKDGTGLNLKVYAHDLAFVDLVFPTKDRVYVDPSKNTFVLPRPNYWSKMESWANVDAADIFEETPAKSYSAVEPDSTTGKFNNGLRFNTSLTRSFNVYPFGLSYTLDKGTASVWYYPGTAVATQRIYIYFGGANSYIQCGRTTLELYINGSSVASYSGSFGGSWHHVYAVWDKAGSLTGSKTVRVFCDGTERLSTTSSWTSGELYCQLYVAGGGTVTQCIIDNLKIWKEIVSEDPSWEYNSGSGREDALHYIYGSTNGYKPLLAGVNNGVGYYQAGGTGSYSKWTLPAI